MPAAARRVRWRGGPANGGKRQQNGQTAAIFGGKLQAPSGGPVGWGQFGDHGGGLGGPQDFLQRPEPVTRPGNVDKDHPRRQVDRQGRGV